MFHCSRTIKQNYTKNKSIVYGSASAAFSCQESPHIMSEGVGVPCHLVLYKYNIDMLDQVDLYKQNTTSSRVLHHLDFYKYKSHTLGTLCTSPGFIQIQYHHSRSTSSPGFIRRRPAIMFPSRVNKSLSPATRQRMQCLRFSTIIIRVMTTVKTIFPGFVLFP